MHSISPELSKNIDVKEIEYSSNKKNELKILKLKSKSKSGKVSKKKRPMTGSTKILSKTEYEVNESKSDLKFKDLGLGCLEEWSCMLDETIILIEFQFPPLNQF